VFLCFQFRSLDQARLLRSGSKSSGPVGQMPPARMAEVDRALKLVLSLE
jgi:mRNA-degrading endonuclease toxin of MazEF toxin-antitoxin module